MAQVGRPAEKDSDGNPISKCLVNVTIPVKLRDFLKSKNINRSQLFTQIVKKMHEKEICPLCYGNNIRESIVGFCCEDCEILPTMKGRYDFWIYLKDCENCNSEYQPPYNRFCQSDNILKGCYDCIRKEDRL